LNNKEFSKKLEVRVKKFAVNIIRLSTKIPNTPKGRIIKTQLIKSGTSVGANYWEANRARSKADFRNKIKICASEASETKYWLEIIVEANVLPKEDVKKEDAECAELIALFSSIGKKL
jgi:four helix bundle protein